MYVCAETNIHLQNRQTENANWSISHLPCLQFTPGRSYPALLHPEEIRQMNFKCRKFFSY